jgi:hypothetical protein
MKHELITQQAKPKSILDVETPIISLREAKKFKEPSARKFVPTVFGTTEGRIL